MFKYLFLANFNDCSTYHQNEQDISEIDPTRSCFYDISKKIESGLILREFILYNDELNCEYKVDLTTGLITLNDFGHIIRVVNPYLNLFNYRIIYFRTHQVSPNDGIDKLVNYQIGWQANDQEGNNYKQIVEIE
jgi:hypothetical protein